jgi:hypothetical protein
MNLLDEMEQKIDQLGGSVQSAEVKAGQAVGYGLIALAKVLEPIAARMVTILDDDADRGGRGR